MIKKVTLTLPLMLMFLHLMYASVGLNWIQILPPSAGGIWSIRVHPTNSDVIYAASNSAGVWKSDDRGLSFAQFNGGLTNLNLQCIAMCRDNPDVLYVGTGPSTPGGVFVTTNGGDTWTFRSTGITQTPVSIQALAVDPSNPNVAYAAVWDGVGVVTQAIFKTTDMGVTWTAATTGLHTGKPILSLAVDWNTTSTLYAGSSFVSPDGPTYVYKSTNGAASWFVSSNGLDTSITTVNPVRALSISTFNPQIILAGLFCNSGAPENGSAWLSTNGGALWTQIRNGLPHGVLQQIRSTFIRWGHDREFWLGYDSPDSGCVYRSTNAGQTWTLYNGGSLLAGNTIRGLWGGSTHMYAGVSVGAAVGMHHNPEPPIGIIGQNGNIPTVFALLQNFPNPFNPATYIQYDIPKESFVTLKVFNVAGKEVASLVNENKRAGSYQIMFDASSLPSGVYFYRITAGDFSDTKKMMLVK